MKQSKQYLIKERITELTGLLAIKISKNVKVYANLSEKEKIPFRIMSAEITALKDLLKGNCLNFHLSVVIDCEHYCGAEGIKRAKDWITNHYTPTKP